MLFFLVSYHHCLTHCDIIKVLVDRKEKYIIQQGFNEKVRTNNFSVISNEKKVVFDRWRKEKKNIKFSCKFLCLFVIWSKRRRAYLAFSLVTG